MPSRGRLPQVIDMSSERFIPERAFIDEDALAYPLTQEIRDRLRDLRVPVRVLSARQRPDIPGSSPTAVYSQSKKTLVVRVRKEGEFQTCKPSAHYQIPLVSSCPGLCEYCYLQATLGPRPYVRVYANLEEVLSASQRLATRREPEVTVFEGSATSDPLAVEHITGSLRRTIEFLGDKDKSRFKFVTKFSDVEPLLGAAHGGNTTVRFSVNAHHVIRTFEHGTAGLDERLQAMKKVREDRYPVGIMVGPVIRFAGWEDGYRDLLRGLARAIGESTGSGEASDGAIPIEIITHRFTSRAKKNILTVFPRSTLPMDESARRLVHGQFGYTKYVYPPETMEEMREFFEREIAEALPQARVQYFV